MTPKTRPIIGHGLAFAGAPYDDDGTRIPTPFGEQPSVGRAKCSCGAMSDPLASNRERQRWHELEHKTAIAA